ncbi:DUF3667 domain-containing protein [Sphingomonas swuensis]|uniref:DUF3667 domain-containing protein n=1 Tax=Sphingomonas swuensis TaxID=977800 RepID=A0ABP7TB04_9SPHN
MNALDKDIAAAQQAQCLNCAAPLSGPFCASCGQKARINRSLAAFFSDLLAGLFNFESRFWRTLPMLAWCPGDLTRRYVEGQRARFISPIALYLFSVFLMFAALGSMGGAMAGLNVNNGLAKARTENQAQLAALDRQRAEAVRTKSPTVELDRQIAAKRGEIADIDRTIKGDFSTELESGNDGAPAWVVEGVRKVAANPREFMSHVQEAASKYSWALIPLSLPFMFLLFPFSRRHVFDHAVFVTYSLSFMMLLILAGSLLVVVGAGIMAPWLLLVPPFHMYRQLKGAYQLRWWSALLRTFVLLTFSFIALLLFAGAMVALNLVA